MEECSKSFYNNKAPMLFKSLREYQVPQGIYFVYMHTQVWTIAEKAVDPGVIPFNISIRL
eukprot:13331959-Ditylum_brightwellii.AAC.1